MQGVQRPFIFNDWDHVQVLNDFLNYKKRLNPRVSIEMIARESKVYKRPLLSLIFAGKRSLTKDKILPLCRALGMTKQESQFFHSLVHFNQSKSPSEASVFLSDLIARRPLSPTIDGDRKVLLSKWYYIPILEFIKLPGFKPEPNWISARFRKKISEKEVREALALLQTLKLVVREDNRWRVVEDTLVSTQDMPSKTIQAYHYVALDRSKDALQEVAIEEREFLSAAFPVSRSEMAEIKEELRRLCKKLIMNRPSQLPADEIASLNIQFYFMTSNIGDRNAKDS